ncbi:MAG: TerB family tellurite resistance protein [Gammaproteobacteria bacterium]|nr:TerB family tellurite resistance protein [Gammaproteobacteria bacterium]
MTALTRLRELLAPDQGAARPAELSESLAVALLLAEVARSDFEVETIEHDRMVELLAQRYQLSGEQAGELTERALARAGDATSLYEYVRVINRNLDYPGRCRLMDLLWRLAYADGRLDPLEEQRLRRLAGMLYLDDADFIRTKLKVLGETE